MKLAYLTSQYPATSHTFIRREVAALRRLDVAVDTFSVRAPSPGELSDPHDLEEQARTFFILSQPPAAYLIAHAARLVGNPLRYLATLRLALSHRAPGLRGLLLGLVHFAEAVVLGRELQRRSIRHLHNHFANSAATVGLLACRLIGIRWSFVVHGPSETDYPAGYLLGRKVEAADMVICISWFGRSQAERLVAPDHWSKFRLVHCGLQLDSLPAVEEAKRDPWTIICVGRLYADKAQAGLLEAFALIGDRYPQARLRLVGDGPERGDLERRAAALGVAGRVSFAGRLGEAATLGEIARAGIMALPSFWEGLPVVLMEAMALRVPVIAARVAGTPELIADGVNGLLFTPAKWSELAACLERLLEDRQLAARLAAAGRLTIEQKFDVDQSARRLRHHFASLHQAPAEARPAVTSASSLAAANR